MTDTALILAAARHLEEAARLLRAVAAPTIPAPMPGPIEDFLNSERISDKRGHTPIRDIHDAYIAWCDERRLEAANINAFGRHMSAAGIVRKRGSNGVRLAGIVLAAGIPAPSEASTTP